jgi:hypothetical protein
MSGDGAAALREIDRAELRMAHETLIARFELGKRFVGRERGRGGFRRARWPHRGPEPKRDRASGAEPHQIPAADSLTFAVNAHCPILP